LLVITTGAATGAVFLLVVRFVLHVVPPTDVFGCPEEIAEIDRALAAGPALPAAELAEVRRLRAEGEALYKAGKHGEAFITFGRAEKMLGVEEP
jgi:hypothetical protein